MSLFRENTFSGSQSKTVNSFPVLIFIFYLCFCSVIAWEHPFYNGDILPYIGAAISLNTTDVKVLHEETYALVKSSVPPEIYSSVTSTLWRGSKHYTDLVGSYYEIAANNNECFYQELPFFYIKPLYVCTIYAAIQLHINPVGFMVIFSIFSSVCLSLFVFIWLCKYMSKAWSTIWSILILSAGGLQEVISITSADMPSVLFAFIGIFLYFEKNRLSFSIISLLIATLFRLDLALVAILILIYDTFVAKQKNRVSAKKLLYLSIFIILPICIERFVGAYSWSTLFYYNFIHLIAFPKNFHSSISLSQYLAIFFQGLRMKPPSNVGWMFIILSVLSLLLNKNKSDVRSRRLHLLLFAQFYIVIRYCLFPILAPRFMFIAYLLIGISFIQEFGLVIGGYPKILQLTIKFYKNVRTKLQIRPALISEKSNPF